MDQSVYPFIQPADWPQAKNVVHRRLAKKEVESPLLTYATKEEDEYRFITELPEGTFIDDLEVRALTTLGSIEGRKWEEIKIGTWNALSASGHEFSSEKMLDPVFMTQGEDLLGCSRLLVAIPRKGVLYAADPHGGEDYLYAFYQLAWRTYRDASSASPPLSPYIFEVAGGWVQGVVQDHKEKVSTWLSKTNTPTPSTQAPASPPKNINVPPQPVNAPPAPPKMRSAPAPIFPPIPPPYPGQISVKADKILRGRYYDLLCTMGGNNLDVLLAKLLEKMQDFVRHYRSRNDISGSFVFNIAGVYTPFDPLLESQVAGLLNRINGSPILHQAVIQKGINIHFKVRYVPSPNQPDNGFERDLLIPA